MIGCDDKTVGGGGQEPPGPNLDLPYSQLTPEEQKVKLENECINLLNELQASSSLQAFDVFENFLDLLDRDDPDISLYSDGSNPLQTIFQASNAYGVYTWNRNKWEKTSSSSELKFIFPPKGTTGANDATLSLKAGNTGITITNVWYDEYWECTEYDPEYGYCYGYKIVKGEKNEGLIYVPTSVSGILSLNSKELAKIEASATYKNKTYDFEDFKTTGYPESTLLKLTTEENYVIQYSLDGRGSESKFEMSLAHGSTALIETLFSLDISFQKIFDKIESIDDIDDFQNAFGKVKTTGYTKLMGKLALIYQVDDMAGFATEMNRIESEYDNAWEELNWNSSDYFTKEGQIYKKYSDDMAKVMNKYVKVSLTSLQEAFQIAELIVKSEKVGEYWDNYKWISSYGGYWNWSSDYPYIKLYDEWGPTYYLKFGDGSLVETEAYFSTGFGKLENKWQDFVNAFDR